MKFRALKERQAFFWDKEQPLNGAFVINFPGGIAIELQLLRLQRAPPPPGHCQVHLLTAADARECHSRRESERRARPASDTWIDGPNNVTWASARTSLRLTF